MARSIRMAEAGPVDGDDPVAFRKPIDEAADHEVLGHGPVAMDQDYGTAFAPGDVVDPQAVHLDKPARGARGLLALLGPQRLPGLPDSFAGLLNSFVPLPDSGAGDLDGGLQGLVACLAMRREERREARWMMRESKAAPQDCQSDQMDRTVGRDRSGLNGRTKPATANR
jgi:hypothetical protein